MTLSLPQPDLRSTQPKLPELLAPAGNWECAKAAVENGADAIYFGLEQFNARMRAENFTIADLPRLMEWLHQRGVKGYVTLNTLIFQAELAAVERYLRSIISAGVDAVIVQDVGLCRLIRQLSPDFPIHASTQMTITSAAGVNFAKQLGCQLVVLARECSLKEINRIQQQLSDRALSLPLEVFVHGALCVAYSGQCLTSEALGGRSANRGECAQACRMPYELIADGQVVDLGDRRYLLSPQDLAGFAVLPEIVRSGVTCLKIEGRLKAPEYVANVTQVYRQALEKIGQAEVEPEPAAPHPTQGSGREIGMEQYNLEMAFSRGLYSGWFDGINNQALVHARFGKKRGVYLGEVLQLHKEGVVIQPEAPVKPGDGVVFDSGHPEAREEGGRVYAVERQGKQLKLTFGRRDVDWRRVKVGDRLWKTSDPELDKRLQQTYSGDTPKFQRPIQVEVHGELGQNLVAIAQDEQGHIVQVESTLPLVAAANQPLTTERLREQFARLGNTPFQLGRFSNQIQGEVLMPVSEINRMRRAIVTELEAQRSQPKIWQLNEAAHYTQLLPNRSNSGEMATTPELIVLVRNLTQLKAALTSGVQTIYCEFEDPRRYKEAVALFRTEQAQRQDATEASIWVAPPRITKPGERWILEQVRAAEADGYLVRNYDHLEFFAGDRCVGDFSLNVANAITADYFKRTFHLERLTASYDLNIQQLDDLLRASPVGWFEVTIHQHMPMFHMEHCVFCAFLSEGTDFTNCGRPCESHTVKLRDRAGVEHLLQADAGCRNTLFNGTAQTGAEYAQRLQAANLRHFRIEFVNENGKQVQQTIRCYQQLLKGEMSGAQLWQTLKLQNQLGVTRGTHAGDRAGGQTQPRNQ
ncbi:MAG TPA: U32 family peptidase [Leptolyngbyaceae cyanobacterium M33_DOE_097]|uniref:U32 family peptidase n=1 Tax=Oscillatoriales cyanobacterium SpSt-418 TaxID=2282169 RepID=A0A7C3KGK7_9CYAN|nr:U32 family peptidase [Leptolyngbyaceae cyanobacterium M33_DOE_097]